MSTPEILKASELAEILGCAVSTIEERARNRQLPGLKFGDGGWVFPTRATVEILNHMGLARMEVQEKPAAVLELASKRTPPTLPSL